MGIRDRSGGFRPILWLLNCPIHRMTKVIEHFCEVEHLEAVGNWQFTH
jgi:hypothetical protein